MKKQFKIALFENSTSLCDKLAVLAAQANGGKKITLQELETVAKGNIIEYPSLNERCVVELVGDHTLHIDRKKAGEDIYETVLSIEQVEVHELENALQWSEEEEN